MINATLDWCRILVYEQLDLTSLTSHLHRWLFAICTLHKFLIVLTYVQSSQKNQLKAGCSPPHCFLKKGKWNQMLITLFWYVWLLLFFFGEKMLDRMRSKERVVVYLIACILVSFYIVYSMYIHFFSSNTLISLIIFYMDSLD